MSEPSESRTDHPFPVVVISDGTVEDNRAKISDVGPLRVLVQPDFSLSQAYDILGTPGAVVVGTDGRIAGRPSHAPDAVRSLHDSLVATMTGAGPTHQHLHEIGQRPAAPGDAVPEVNLLAEDGSEISLDEAVGEEAVLVFWRVDCGFCQRMLDDLRVLEEDVTVRLVTGSDLAAIRESGLVSPVLRDRDGALERWLQVPGTPSAARVRDGVLDSGVVVGGPDVTELLRSGSRRLETAETPH